MLAPDSEIVRIPREMRSGIVWSFLLVQVSSWMVAAQEAVPTKPVEPAPEVKPARGKTLTVPGSKATEDYGPAVERLIKLGLPDAKGAKYVKLTLHGEAGQRAQMEYYESGMGGSAKTGAKGDAWLLPVRDEDGGLARLVHGGYGTVKVKKKQKRGGLMRLLVGPEKETKSGGVAGDWTEQNVADDTIRIIEAIEKQRAENKLLDPDQWEYSNNGALWCSGILVHACHMYRAGHTREANQIIGKLMESAPKPVLVIDQVVNSLADRSYQALAEAFFANKDWVAYRDGAKSLLESFTRGWKSREGVEMLVAQLDQRIKGEKPKIKTLKGVKLNPEALAILDGLLTREEDIVVDAPMMWVLGEDAIKRCSSDPNVSYYMQPSKQDWVKQLIAMGPDAVIALASAVTDHSLMASKMGSSDGGDYGFRGMRYSMMSSSGSDAATAQYNALSRPCSRGEIARKLLAQTLPDSDNELSSHSAEELQSIAYQWWLKHRSDSESALARHFLEEGSSTQKRVAVVMLIKSGEPGSFKLVEEYILGSEEMDDQLGNATLYLKARRGKARKFYDQFAKALKEEAAGQDEDYLSWEIRQAGGVDKYLKKLEVYVSDVSAEKILADMRSGKLKAKEGIEMLKVAVSEDDMLKQLPTLVKIARDQKEIEQQVELMEQVSRLFSNQYYSVSRDDDDDETSEESKAYVASVLALLEASKDDWQWFLSQTEPVDVEDRLELLNGAPSLAAYMAWQMEYLYFPQHQQVLYVLNQVMSTDELWAFGLKRAQAVLNEGAGAYFPDAESVKEARRAEIRKDLGSISPGKVLAYYKGLSLDEKVAWPDIIDEFEEDQPKVVAQGRRMIKLFDWNGAGDVDESFKAELDRLFTGKEMDESTIKAMLAHLAKNAEQHHDVVLLANEGWGSFGIRFYVLRGQRAKLFKQRYISRSGVYFEPLKEGKQKKLAAVIVRGERRSMAIDVLGEPVIELKPEEGEEEEETPAQLIEELTKSGDYYTLMFMSETEKSYQKFLEDTSKDEDEDF